jgi:hypothetical protein
MDGFLMVIFLFYGVALAMLYHYSAGIASSLLIAPILLRLFPGFSLKTSIISPHYPQTKWVIAALDLVAMGFWKTRNAIYLLFLLSFYSFSPKLPSGTLTTLILLLAIGIVMAESLMNALSWRIYFHTTILAIVFIALLWTIRHTPIYLNLSLAATLIFLLCLYFLFYNPELIERQLSAKRATTLNPYLLVIAGNRSFLIVLAIGMVFKVLIMATFIFSKGLTMNEVVSRVPFILCLLTPIILFSYIYNNFWGYFYTIAINNLLSGNNTNRQIRIYLYFLAPALLLDGVLTLATLLSGHMLDIKIILSYLAIAALCIPIGIISSFRKYFFVPKAFDLQQMRGKTSKLFTFSLLIAGLLLGLLYNEGRLFGIALAGIITISIALFLYIHKKQHSLLNKLKGDFFS